MKFSLVVYSAPYSSPGAYSAYRFAQACLQSGHQIYRVFFYGNGVQTGSCLSTPQQDEFDLHGAWQQLAQEHQLDLVVCIAAALKRGVLDQKEQQRYQKSAANLAPEFELSGLGQLADAAAQSDRLLTFA